MRARAVALATLASVSIVGIGWQLGSSAIEASQSLTASSGGTAMAATVTATTDAAARAAAAAKGAADVAAAAKAQADTANTAASAQAAADAAAANAAAAAQAAATAAAATAAQAAAQSGTFTGAVVQTQYGNMQVSVTIANGAITEVLPLQLTNRGGRSVGISNQAAPILRSEVLTAQSAKVQNVSGATYTSEGYLRSLQSALDTAGF
ncbi:FMN-binding protein [Cryobacterium sp. Y57]|uniref:FMN-binding protein n=1 Tax=Cryobacterium sp. Y57 TaxID=2048287 RepID=UPI001E436EF8|nr:FMN-binding protein [Cryobacterium sp. Y57]